MGSEGTAGGGDGVTRAVHTELPTSSRLVLVVVAAFLFPAPWDGAGDAGMDGAAQL